MNKASLFFIYFLLEFLLICLLSVKTIFSQNSADAFIKVFKTENFAITGTGSSEHWSKTEWIELTQRTNQDNSTGLKTSVKVLYSDTGMYFLFYCQDERITATIKSDFKELWHEDVVEVFLWPNEGEEVYFEYELSPLNYELPILVSKTNTGQSHWIPFNYSYKDDRKTKHKTTAVGGTLGSGEKITEWRAEFFIPFELLRPLKNAVPQSGSTWRANMYRVDYDRGSTNWTWQPVSTDFHDIYNYGTLIFE